MFDNECIKIVNALVVRMLVVQFHQKLVAYLAFLEGVVQRITLQTTSSVLDMHDSL